MLLVLFIQVTITNKPNTHKGETGEEKEREIGEEKEENRHEKRACRNFGTLEHRIPGRFHFSIGFW